MSRSLLALRGLIAAVTVSLAAESSAAQLACGEEPADTSRIVVAGGSLTEIVFALGAQDQVVAVDVTSTYPPAATQLPQIGYVRDLSAEGLLSLEPTLILAEHDAGPPDVMAQLDAVGIEVLRVPETFSREGIEAKIHCVAAALGTSDRGAALVESLATLPAAPLDTRGLVTIGIDGGAPLVAGTNTSGDGLLAMAGVGNLVAHEGWKPVSREAMVALAPAFLLISERGLRQAGGMDKLLDHPALRLTPAAQNRRVIVMDGMAMLGFGPRTVEAARSLRAALEAPPVGTES